MTGSLVLKLSGMVLLCMVVAAPVAEAVITCGQVASSVGSCIGYLRGTVPTVPPSCCNGVKSLNKAAATTADRQAACECLKKTSGSIPGLNPGLAAGLPGKCGVSVPYKISTSTNCKAVK
uniref:Non-specific lipid-transfer protein n=1 Tax=Juglans regia TaxID=51240 RepID=C5H617_JUGRE|nr:nonspecific lipid transfer protein [Juglans regia]